MTTNQEPDFLHTNSIFRTLIEESPTPVALYVGRDMHIQLANDAMLKLWGKSNTVISKTLREALPELEGQPFHQILNDVLTTGIPYEATEDRVDLFVNGSLQTFYFNFTYKPLKNADGIAWGILNTATEVTELALTRKKLAESEESTRFALEAGELGTWDLDPINNIVSWDERCKQLYGLSKAADIIYEDVLSLIHPEDVDRVNKAVQEALDPRSGGNYLIDFRTIGGEDKILRWLRCKGRAYFNEDGVPYRFAGTALDVTREVDDNKQQRRLTALIENSDDFICITDLDNTITYLNKAGLDILGITELPENLTGTDTLMPEDISLVETTVLPALHHQGKWAGQLRYRNLVTNQPVPVYVNAFRIDGPITGKPIGLASVCRDLRPEIAANTEKNNLLALIDNSSVFVALSTLEGKVTYVNTFGRDMMGIDSLQDAIRINSDYTMPGEVERIMPGYRKSMAETGSWSGRLMYRHFKTGEAIPVEGRTVLVYDSLTGLPNGRASIVRDLRQEIADKKALEESEHLLYNITSASPTALWMSDRNGQIIYANQTWVEWTGQSMEEILGTGWTNAIVPEDRQQAAETFISDLQAQRHYEVSFRIKRKDGEIRWCVATGNPQYHSDGTFAGYIGSCTDVTDKILVEQEVQLKNRELNEQIKQFEFVTDFMPAQLWTANTAGELDYVNRRTEEFFGTNAHYITGSRWQTFIHTDDLQPAMEAWMNSLVTGNEYQVEFRLRDRNGNYKWHLARAYPFIIDGQIVKWFGTNTDIDEQKQLQRQKDDFLGIASHELKTPVTSIKAYAQVLGAMLTKEGEHRKAEMVNRMDSQVNRLTNLIGDLLDVTKINSGRLQFTKTWFNLNKVIHDTIADMQHTTLKHKLVEDFTETGKIYADKDRIEQVVTNLISNAIKYMPSEGNIIISTSVQNNEVTVCVQDFGIGIATDKKDRVFEQFYRVSGSKQHTFPGLGLGLYISSEIIKREGGRMWVNSVEGKGSTFCFALPLVSGINTNDLLHD
jgi:PAS domain S-box-containing protein